MITIIQTTSTENNEQYATFIAGLHMQNVYKLLAAIRYYHTIYIYQPSDTSLVYQAL